MFRSLSSYNTTVHIPSQPASPCIWSVPAPVPAPRERMASRQREHQYQHPEQTASPALDEPEVCLSQKSALSRHLPSRPRCPITSAVPQWSIAGHVVGLLNCWILFFLNKRARLFFLVLPQCQVTRIMSYLVKFPSVLLD